MKKHINNKDLKEIGFQVVYEMANNSQDIQHLSELITQMVVLIGIVDKFYESCKENLETLPYDSFLEAMMPKIGDNLNKLQMLPSIFEEARVEILKPNFSLMRVQSEILNTLMHHHKYISKLQGDAND